MQATLESGRLTLESASSAEDEFISILSKVVSERIGQVTVDYLVGKEWRHVFLSHDKDRFAVITFHMPMVNRK